ncbi:N-acetylglutamate synthase [Microthyrium microscopicum]|uniref:Amino-acid acetyltransferase, mitochondrial n=1 Tax=Microthyrium microscopicum TaxID=703497 RepID=A0A6A6UMA2_9PEZI|nr:N-acetylglutamate synthase [Microthyrium microscopicum]
MASARLVSKGGRLQQPVCNTRNNLLSVNGSQRRYKADAVAERATPTNHVPPSNQNQRMRAKMVEREFFESVLGASATKRDAKTFLSRFTAKPSKEKPASAATEERGFHAKINLGNLYTPTKAIANSPVFTQQPSEDFPNRTDGLLHTSIVKISDLRNIDDETLNGIATTLVQLGRLGVRLVIVLEGSPDGIREDTQDLLQQARRVVDVLHQTSEHGARLVDHSFAFLNGSETGNGAISGYGNLEFQLKDLLLSPLTEGIITVIPPLAQTCGSRVEKVEANYIIAALTKYFADQNSVKEPTQGIKTILDRIVFLDPIGGMPNPKTDGNAHVFVNLAQDYSEIREDLETTSTGAMTPDTSHQHLENLECIQKCLAILPSTASALIATPLEVAKSSSKSSSISTTGVFTRPKRNALIHNILTDKPLVSASLPLARLYDAAQLDAGQRSSSTFFKNGMPLTIVPDPRVAIWSDPGVDKNTLELDNDPRVDWPKLVHLIEDSFGRPLNAEHYLKRIQNRVAGIIIAGDYEGGAILTWEQPTGRPGRPTVPYLDKFAVLRRCQGSGGVADILFNAMVNRCFPEGVVWRSRQTNPVNKWYFERATATWKIPESNWTMFWTGNEVDFGAKGMVPEDVKERWLDYVAVCSHIAPSWADQKPPD